MDINIRAFGGEVQCFCYNFSPTRPTSCRTRRARRQQPARRPARPVDPDSEGTVHRRMARRLTNTSLRPRLVVGAKFTNRKLGRVIEDFLIPERAATSSPTRQGIGKEMGFYDFVHTAAAPKPTRKSTGVRDHGAQALQQQLAVPGERRLQQARRQLRRHVPGLDRPARSEHQLGVRLRRLPGERRRQLSNDRNVQLKLDGSYEFCDGRAEWAEPRRVDALVSPARR